MSGPEQEHTPPGAVDARFTLAAERTMLAWVRTSLGLIAAGVAVVNVLPGFSSSAIRAAIGIGLVAMGLLSAVVGGLRWRKTQIALRDGGPMPGPAPIWMIICLLVILSITVLVAVVADP
ncbi:MULTISPECIES: DUF202 domain-containing protein [Actinomycetes]|uniref:YidH family protein n=1 Tax=Actinomycetes TaxID=1760 RepID=UPI0004BE7648|nr:MULTISPECIES: DUF202 domain-containing protein [Actinomycetes]